MPNRSQRLAGPAVRAEGPVVQQVEGPGAHDCLEFQLGAGNVISGNKAFRQLDLARTPALLVLVLTPPRGRPS
jgi:hypothetical protein